MTTPRLALAAPLFTLLACTTTTVSITEPPTLTPAATGTQAPETPEHTAAANTTTPGAPTPPAFGEVVQSDKDRDTEPEVSEQDTATLVAGNTAFALDLYQQVRGAEGNLFYSPHSMSIALGMTYAGARQNTEAQMAQTLHFDLPQANLHPAFNALDLTLASRADDALNSGALPFKLNIVNATWGQSGYTFLDPFLDTLAVNYGAAMRLVDYVGDTEGARQDINGWVEHETEGKIDELIPTGVLTVDTRLVLVNAIFFSASWKYPFSEEATASGPFTRLDGTTVTVDMMKQTLDGGGFQAVDGEGYVAVEMPYDGDQLSMVMILPDEGEFEAIEAGLTTGTLNTMLAGLAPAHVSLSMPKFAYRHDLPLAAHLQALGMTDAFVSGVADLSGMDGTPDLFIQDVLHQAYISVDEAGTEAAAATAVVVGIESVPMDISIDRPFIFMIRDNPTGAILFISRMTDPTAG